MNYGNISIDSNVINPDGQIDTNLIISLLKEYVNPNTPWTHDPQGNPLSPEQLLAIWEKEKKELIKQMHIKDSQEEYVSEMKYSEINNELVKISFKTTDSFESALLVCAQEEDWDGLLEILGDEEEDIIFVNDMKDNPEHFKEIIAEFFDEEMIEKIAAFECGYCKIGQRAIPIDEVKREIQGGEDLSKTEYGPIDDSSKLVNAMPSMIVEEAIADANNIIPIGNKEILTMKGDPLGVAETDLTRKIIKRRMIEQIDMNANPDGTVEEQVVENVKNSIWEAEKGNELVAFRVNPTRIKQETDKLLSEVRSNIPGNEPLPEDLEVLVLTLATAATIAHEAQHAINMTSEKGDDSGESDAERTEKNFLEQMLKTDKYKSLKGLITIKGDSGNQESDFQSQDEEMYQTANSWGFYKI